SPTGASAPHGAKASGSLVRLARGLQRTIMLAILTAVLGFAGGFLWFVSGVPTKEITLDRKADGIVVLTGGASRIADAIDLLAAEKGTRLLISGTYRATSPVELARLSPE